MSNWNTRISPQMKPGTTKRLRAWCISISENIGL